MADNVAINLHFEINRQLIEIKRQFRQQGGYPHDPHQLKAALQAIIEGRFGSTEELFRFIVDYDRSLVHMIEDCKCDRKNSSITAKNFPVEGKGKVEAKIKLVHFNRIMASDEVLREFDTQGLRPATLPELLAFGATWPEKQLEFPIVALGSVWRSWNGDRVVPFLWGDSSERCLDLYWLELRWNSYYRFAAVREGGPLGA